MAFGKRPRESGVTGKASRAALPRREASRHIINRKANAKLDYVVSCYENALGKHVREAERGFLDKTLRLQGLRFLEELRMVYKIENRFFAISYDLLYETRLKPAQPAPEGVAFAVRLKGGLGIRGAAFVRASDADRDFSETRLARLNIPLIIERVVSLSLTDVSVAFADGEWRIACRTLIGATTWNLIPPLTQLIKPREAECVRVIEFFELVADALLRA